MTYTFLSRNDRAAERRRDKFDGWLEKIPRWHENFIWTTNESVNWSAPAKPLSEARVALVSTAGVHLKSQEPFDVVSEEGDWSYRVIPPDVQQEDLMVSDTHYDHSDADQDINCLMGIHRLHELAEDGVIGEVAPRFFGFMGFIPRPQGLVEESAPAVADMLVKDEVDLVLLTPG